MVSGGPRDAGAGRHLGQATSAHALLKRGVAMTIFMHDEDLLFRLRAGDRKALSTVYWHYLAAVETLLRRCLAAGAGSCAHRASSDASDVLQDVFVKAFGPPARLGYDSGREYRPFLMAIARNVLVDHLRGVSREGRSHRGAIDARVAGGGDHGDSVPWADAHTISLAERYVANLGDPERGVYLERYVRCRSQEHSALELGLSRQQVRAIEGKLHAGLARAISRANLGVSALRGRPAGALGRPFSGLLPLGLSLAPSRESPRVTAEPEPGS